MGQDDRSPTVDSKRGFWATLNTILIFTVGAGLIGLAIPYNIAHGVGLNLFVALAIGIPSVLVAVSGFTLRMRIHLDHIDKWDVWGHRSVHWVDVREVQINPTMFGTFVFIIYLNNGVRRLTLLVPLIGNRIEVAQAILEAATSSNPTVVVNAPLGSPYGQPPYGLFGSEGEAPGN